jgi:hypothetical protein
MSDTELCYLSATEVLADDLLCTFDHLGLVGLGKIAAPDPGERDQLGALVSVEIAHRLGQFAEGGIAREAFEYVALGVVDVLVYRPDLGLVLAGLDHDEASLINTDIAHGARPCCPINRAQARTRSRDPL